MKKTFHVYTEPHIADPAWVAPVLEINGDGETIHHATAMELAHTAINLQYKIGFEAGRQATELKFIKALASRMTDIELREILYQK